MSELNGWTPREAPSRKAMEGRYVRLEPLDPREHGEELFALSAAESDDGRFRWLAEYRPASLADFQPWLVGSAASTDPLHFVVIDRASGRMGGRQAFMRIDRANGVIEIGAILWADLVARRAAATEALFLFARHAFDELGYRRLEWKCNNLNTPSKRAAMRFGFTFEGLFRQHMVVKGESRDTAWFAMLDRDWPSHRAAFDAWLAPENFDSNGTQIRRLQDIRAAMRS